MPPSTFDFAGALCSTDCGAIVDAGFGAVEAVAAAPLKNVGFAIGVG